MPVSHSPQRDREVDEADLIIIGAGIAGLGAGCCAQMNGYQTRIFEMHTLPGDFDEFLNVLHLLSCP